MIHNIFYNYFKFFDKSKYYHLIFIILRKLYISNINICLEKIYFLDFIDFRNIFYNLLCSISLYFNLFWILIKMRNILLNFLNSGNVFNYF